MNQFRLSTKLLSDAFWKAVFNTNSEYEGERRQLLETLKQLDSLRIHADYNTGSIGSCSAWSLYSVCRYFSPARAIEVGTFIGKSTLSIAIAMDALQGNQKREIHTCDLSNNISIPWHGQSKIYQYSKQSSTQMLNKLEGTFDFAHIDGRLQIEDISLLSTLLDSDSVIALDDFEGIEKGVANLMNIRARGAFKEHLLIYPCSESISERYGFSDRSLTAILLPTKLIALTSQ